MKRLVIVLVVWLPITTVISMEIGWHAGATWQLVWFLPSLLIGIGGGVFAARTGRPS